MIFVIYGALDANFPKKPVICIVCFSGFWMERF